MKRRSFVAGAAALGASVTATPTVFAQTATPAAEPDGVGVQSGYAPVNGLQMYYEIHGEGDTPPSSGGGLGGVPLVLLHGAFATIDMWGPILETLAADHQVIAVEFQAHGHTADIDRPFDYEQFADDVGDLVDHLGIAQADVVGYSMGGITALQVAIQRPELVRKLVMISGGYRHDGLYPEIYAGIETLTPEMFAGSPLEEAYLRNAPDPAGFPALVEKMKDFEATEYAWPDEEVAAVAAPTLLIIADSDVVRLEHAVELFRLLGGGVVGDLAGLPDSQLAIIPGATHVGMAVDRTHLWLPMVEEFLAAPMPEAE